MDSFFKLLSAPSTQQGTQSAPSANSGTTLLAARLQNSSYDIDGTLVYNPGGPFQEYLLRVEDAVILHLLSWKSLDELKDCASIFIAAVSDLGDQKDPIDATYISSPVGQIRICIRMAACHNPANIITWIDKVISRISASDRRVKPFERQALRTHAKSLSTLAPRYLSYYPLDDEPLAQVLHLNRTQLPPEIQQKLLASSSPIPSKTTTGSDQPPQQTQNFQSPLTLQSFGIRVSQCGSVQVRSTYTPVAEAVHPCYSNPQGYIITRARKTINSIVTDDVNTQSDAQRDVDSAHNAEGTDENPRTVEEMSLFVWYLTNPVLSSVYYYCVTVEPSPLPPALGWHQTGLGKLPPPVLQIVPINEEDVNAGNGALAGSGKVGKSKDEEMSTNFAPVRRIDEKGNEIRRTDGSSKPMALSERLSAARGSRSRESATVSFVADLQGSDDDYDNHKNGDDTFGRNERDGNKVQDMDAIETSIQPNLDETNDGIDSSFMQRRLPPEAAAIDHTLSHNSLLDVLRSDSEARLGDVLELELLLNRCTAMGLKLNEELSNIASKLHWLDNADAELLLAGFRGEHTYGSLVSNTDQETGESESTDTFNSEWSLDNILKKLEVQPPPVSPPPNAILDAIIDGEISPEKPPRDSPRASLPANAAVGRTPTQPRSSSTSTPPTSSTSFPLISPSPSIPEVARRMRDSIAQSPTISAPVDMLRRLRDGFFGSPVPTRPSAPLSTNTGSRKVQAPFVYADRANDDSSVGGWRPISQFKGGSNSNGVGGKMGESNGGSGGGKHRRSSSSPAGFMIEYLGDTSVLNMTGEEEDDEDLRPCQIHTKEELQAQCLEDFLEMALPDRYGNSFSAHVEVLGVEMWPPFKGAKLKTVPERLTYVLRVSLSDICTSNEAVGLQNNHSKAEVVSSSEHAIVTEAECESVSVADVGDGEVRNHEGADNDGDSHKATNEESAGNPTTPAVESVPLQQAQKANVGQQSPEPTAAQSFSSFAKEVLSRIDSSAGIDSRHVFTVRRDLPSLCAFHSELTQLLQHTDIFPPPFPDPFQIGNVEEEVVRRLNANYDNKKKLRYGQPFIPNTGIPRKLTPDGKFVRGTGGKGDGGTSLSSSRHQKHSGNVSGKEIVVGVHELRALHCMASIQDYLQGAIALMEFIDDHASQIVLNEKAAASVDVVATNNLNWEEIGSDVVAEKGSNQLSLKKTISSSSSNGSSGNGSLSSLGTLGASGSGEGYAASKASSRFSSFESSPPPLSSKFSDGPSDRTQPRNASFSSMEGAEELEEEEAEVEAVEVEVEVEVEVDGNKAGLDSPVAEGASVGQQSLKAPFSPNSSSPTPSVSSSSIIASLPSKLGQLIGNFLQATDLEDILNVKKNRRDNTPLAKAEGDMHGPYTLNKSAKSTRGNRLCVNVDAASATLSTTSMQRKTFFRPFWYPFASSGLRMYLSVHDDQGGRLSLKSEEELLRSQRSKCIGCGEPLMSGFFGLDRNYQPCRFYGGLFCKRWCHNDDHRIIPHRLLLYWDNTAHRVSRQAAVFLDDTWGKPLLKLNAVNPLLYEGVPALRMAKSIRQRIGSIIEAAFEADTFRARDAILTCLGANRVYLCVSVELYSMRDLVEVQSGALLGALQQLLDELKRIQQKKPQMNTLTKASPMKREFAPL